MGKQLFDKAQAHVFFVEPDAPGLKLLLDMFGIQPFYNQLRQISERQRPFVTAC